MGERHPEAKGHDRNHQRAETPFEEGRTAAARLFRLRRRLERSRLPEIGIERMRLRQRRRPCRRRLRPCLRLWLRLRSLGLRRARLRRTLRLALRLPLWLGLTLRLRVRPRRLRRRLAAGPGLRLLLRMLRIRPRMLLGLRLRLSVLPRRLRLRRRGSRPVRPGIPLRRRSRLRGRRPGNVERVRRRCRPGIGRRERVILRFRRRRHHRHVGHLFRLELDDPRLELRIDAPEQRPHIEIEQRAIGVHHAAGLGPRRQCIKRALLERLHDVGPGPESLRPGPFLTERSRPSGLETAPPPQRHSRLAFLVSREYAGADLRRPGVGLAALGATRAASQGRSHVQLVSANTS